MIGLGASDELRGASFSPGFEGTPDLGAQGFRASDTNLRNMAARHSRIATTPMVQTRFVFGASHSTTK